MRASQIRVKPSHHEARMSRRLGVSFDASLREPGSTKFRVTIDDMSQSGFRCNTSFTLIPNNVVWLTIPGLAPLEARVAWRKGYLYGFAFALPLHVAVFEHIYKQVGKPAL